MSSEQSPTEHRTVSSTDPSRSDTRHIDRDAAEPVTSVTGLTAWLPHLDEQRRDNPVAPFTLNHPKNYFGVPIAVAAEAPTDTVIEESLTTLVSRAKTGAEALGLITTDHVLTDRGEAIVATVQEHESIPTALTLFESLQGSRSKFIDAVPRYWTPLVRDVLQQHTATGDVVTLLERTGAVTLAELAAVSVRTNHPVQEILLRDPGAVCDAVDGDRERVSPSDVASPTVYAGQGIYQFKTFLYHCGVLTERGADTSAIVPGEDVWAIDPSLMTVGGDV